MNVATCSQYRQYNNTSPARKCRIIEQHQTPRVTHEITRTNGRFPCVRIRKGSAVVLQSHRSAYNRQAYSTAVGLHGSSFQLFAWLGWQMSYPIPGGSPTHLTLRRRSPRPGDYRHACGRRRVPIHLVFDKPLKESRFEAICDETC